MAPMGSANYDDTRTIDSGDEKNLTAEDARGGAGAS